MASSDVQLSNMTGMQESINALLFPIRFVPSSANN